MFCFKISKNGKYIENKHSLKTNINVCVYNSCVYAIFITLVVNKIFISLIRKEIVVTKKELV